MMSPRHTSCTAPSIRVPTAHVLNAGCLAWAIILIFEQLVFAVQPTLRAHPSTGASSTSCQQLQMTCKAPGQEKVAQVVGGHSLFQTILVGNSRPDMICMIACTYHQA